MVVDGGAVEACEQLERRFQDKYKRDATTTTTTTGNNIDDDDSSPNVPTGLSLQTYRYSFLDLHPDMPADVRLLDRVRHFDHNMMSGPLTFGGPLGVVPSFSSTSLESSLSSFSSSSSSSSSFSSSDRQRERSKSPMDTGRSRSGRSRSRSNARNSNPRGSANTSGQPTFIMPSFLAPLTYGLPDDDQNIYWPTKNHDIRNVIDSFTNGTLPPPPTEEECARIQTIRDQLYNASWKDEHVQHGSGAADGTNSSSSSTSSSSSSSSSATEGKSGKRKRDGAAEEDEKEGTPRVKSRKGKGAGDIYTKRMRDKQGGR